MGKSLAEELALYTPEEQELVLQQFDPDVLQHDWSFWGRPEQFAPEGEWNIWLVLAGRGFGKTRLAAEWVREEAKSLMPDGSVKRFALVARTAADTRDVIVEGESGIMNISPPGEAPDFEPSKRRLTWPNGNTATLFTADEPSNLRGPQFTHAWGDEIAAWRRLPDDSGLTAWDNLRIATRLGPNPQILVTTTPKRAPLLYDLIKEAKKSPDTIKITKGKTSDNSGNLASTYLDSLTGMYGGTAIAKQELEGEMLDEADGALWTQDMMDEAQVDGAPDYAPLGIIGVDPSVAENPKDECGIVVVCSTAENKLYQRRAWVLEDASIKGSPTVWTKRVVDMARKWGYPVVVENNQGGAMSRNLIHSIDPTIKVYEVNANQGKKIRAEPVSLAYQQGRVKHIPLTSKTPKSINDVSMDLETQMITWVPEDKNSPDRIDALVHALTALLISPPPGFYGGPLKATNFADRKINLPSRTQPAPSHRQPVVRKAGRGGGAGTGGGFRVR